jgi:hypothetical protein
MDETESAIQTAKEGKPEIQKAALELKALVSLSTEQHFLRRLTGEGPQSVAAAAVEEKNFDMLRWDAKALVKSLEMRDQIVEKGQLVKYLGERMQELVEALPVEEVGPGWFKLTEGDFRKLAALGDRIDAAERGLTAVYEEIAKVVKEDREWRARLLEGMEGCHIGNLQAELDKYGITKEKIIELTQKNIERLRQKHLNMRKQATRGLEHY